MTYGDEPMHPVLDASKTQAHGLTKREYFAGLAMQALIASEELYITKQAVQMADALIEELNKPKP